MPTRLTVKNRKFFRELENGSNFSLNPTSYGTHLKGSVGDRIKMTCDIELYKYIELNNYIYTNNGTSDHTIFIDGGFSEGGLWVGDSVKIRFGSGVSDFEITSISDDFLTLSFIGGYSQASFTNGAKDRLKLSIPSTDLRYTFNNQEQLESFDLKSIINGSESSFIVKEIDGTLKSGDWSNTNKSLKYGSLKCVYNAGDTTNDDDPRGGDQVVFHYSIEHEFIITPYFIDGWNLSGQLPDIFQDENTLRYVANYGFRRGYNNPNTELKGIDDNGLGSVGFFNETFNGFDQRYFIDNYRVTDQNDFELSGVNVAEVNKIKFNLTTDKISGGFNTNTHNFVAYISKRPDFDKYNFSNTDDFSDIWGYYGSRGVITNTPQSLSGYFSSANINIIDDQNAEVELILSFPTDYINRTENDDKYFISFEVGDTTLVVDDTDSCNILCEENTFSKDINIQGLVINNPFEIKRTSEANTTGYTDFKGWIQHGVNISNKFSINLNDNAQIDSLSVGIIAKKSNDFFDVYRYNFNLSTVVNNGGVQNIVIDSSQNYKLIEGSIFNEIKLSNTGQLVAGEEDYELSYGLKIPYQDWQQLTTAPNEFYNVNKELNGLNKNASNYIANGYTLHFFTDINASQFDIPTLYRNISEPIQVLNFGDDGNNPIQWSGTIETFNLNGNDLGGAVLVDEPTHIKATFNAPSSLTEIFGAIRIGVKNHGGNAVDELTNVTFAPSDNRLIPLDGDNELRVVQVGNVITLECMTNVEQLENEEYVISAECYDPLGVVITGAFSNAFANSFDN